MACRVLNLSGDQEGQAASTGYCYTHRRHDFLTTELQDLKMESEKTVVRLRDVLLLHR
jgi:hypothetical protein